MASDVKIFCENRWADCRQMGWVLMDNTRDCDRIPAKIRQALTANNVSLPGGSAVAQGGAVAAVGQAGAMIKAKINEATGGKLSERK